MKKPRKEPRATTSPPDATTNGVTQPPSVPAKKKPPMSKKEFESKNKRRLELLGKEFDGGELTKEEEQELAELTKETERYVDAVYPLPFAMLDELRDIARREGLIDKKPGA